MGYFSNGCESDAWTAEWCDNCIFGDKCPIWHMQMDLNYQRCNELGRLIDILIPIKDNGFCGACVGFMPKSRTVEKGLTDD